jgi:thioesterase-3
VNNARYLEFFEEARWDALKPERIDQYLNAHALSFVVVNIKIDYKKPCVPGDVVQIRTEISEYGNSSFTFSQSLSNQDGFECSKAIVKLVVIDIQSGKPYRLSVEFKQLIQDVISEKTQ